MQRPSIFNKIWCNRLLNVTISCTRRFGYKILVIRKGDETKHHKDIHKSRHSTHTLRSEIRTAKTERGYNIGRFGFERSFPENPALINAFFNCGINKTVKMNAAME